jgi:hypothetical protein
MFTTAAEPTYKTIKRKWLTDSNAIYGVIHRIAVAENCTTKGIANMVIFHCENLLQKQSIPSMRIDTHPYNLLMQHILKKIQYTYCGIITLESEAIRLAYEKVF